MSTFSGLSVALSSLYAQRRGIDVTGQNIANANTDGYTRQRVELQSVSGSITPAMYSTPDPTGAGVTVVGVGRIQDQFLVTQDRLAHAQNSFLADQSSMFTQLQGAFDEPSDTGLQSQLSALSASWHDLSNTPNDPATGTAVLSAANTVVDTMHATRTSVVSLYATTRVQLDAYANDINTTAKQIAQLNQQVVVAGYAGMPTNELADQRDNLVMHLSELTGASSSVMPDGSATVTIGGSSLVSGNSARVVSAVGSMDLDGAAGAPATLQWNDNGATVTADSGTVGSMLQTLNTTLPAYAGQLDSLAATLASTVNAQHNAGFDVSGNAGTDFFGTTDGQPVNAGNITVAITDPKLLASSSAAGTLDGVNADALGNLGQTATSADATYRQIVVKLGNDVQSAQRRADVQSPVTDNADAAAQSQSGVNLDEEMTNLMAYQRGYQAASRVINTIDQCLDTLINHTGS